MKRFLLAGLLIALAITAVPQQADAQFFKKLFGKKEQTRKPARKPAPKGGTKINAAANKNVPKKKTHADQLDYPKTVKKERYRVDVLASLYLNELVKDDKPVFKDKLPEKAQPGINFYQGIKLAADTLNGFGYNIDVYVHDITDPLTATETLININAFENSDLIIGAVNAPQVAGLARYADQHHINFVSVLSPSDGSVKDNFYFTLLQPTLQSHCDWLRKSINKQHPRKPWLVYHRVGTPADENAWKLITEAGKGDEFREIKCATLPPQEQLYLLFDSSQTNVIVMPVLDAAYAEKLIQQLSTAFPTYRFDVYGMPSWKGMPALRKPLSWPNVTVLLTAPYYFDGATSSGQALSQRYHQEFGGRPGEMVFRGYETLYWYGYLLNRYGTIFNDNLNDNGATYFTRYDVKPKWDKDDNLLYNENQHLYLYRFQSGSYSVEQ